MSTVQTGDIVIVDFPGAQGIKIFLATMPANTITRIGHCSTRDWQGIVDCLQKALPLSA